jgi:hypothetical protein
MVRSQILMIKFQMSRRRRESLPARSFDGLPWRAGYVSAHVILLPILLSVLKSCYMYVIGGLLVPSGNRHGIGIVII